MQGHVIVSQNNATPKYTLHISLFVVKRISQSPRGGGVLPYKGLMGTCGQPGYVFLDFCLKQGISNLSFFVLIRVSIYQFLS